MKKKLFAELKEALDEAVQHAKGEKHNLRTTVYSDGARFVLNPEQWQEFDKKLRAEPREIPALRELLKKLD